MKETSAQIQIIHQPYGFEHPYEQTPWERFPRDPLEGEPVVLGLATEPAGLVEEVWVIWSAGDGVEHVAWGRWIEESEERDIWQATLPPSWRGERISYRAHARGGGHVARTESFSFVVSIWQTVQGVRELSAQNGILVLDLSCDDLSLEPQIRFSVPEAGHLRFDVVASGLPSNACPENPTGTGVPLTLETDRGGPTVAHWGGIGLVIEYDPLCIRVLHGSSQVLLTSSEMLAFLVRERDRALMVRQSFVCQENEAFWGFGERFNSLDQRGNMLDVRVYEQYKNQGLRTYLPVPFFVSSQGYGLYLDTARYVVYDLAASEQDRWSFRAELGEPEGLSCDLFLGEPKQVIPAFVKRTGQPVLPPAWAFGPWMSGNDWNSQAIVEQRLSESARHGIPASVLVIEAWSDEATFYIWNEAQYEPRAADEPLTYADFVFPAEGKWPDPKRMIDDLHCQGTRIFLWQIPVLKKMARDHLQHQLDESHMLEQGFCVKESDGRPYHVRPFWFHEGLVLDFTNPQAVEWWLRKRQYLLTELGVDGFKTDGGEHLFGRELRFADGHRGDELWNVYPNLYVGAYHQFARSLGREIITLSRAGFTGAQAFPCHWAGDEDSTWEAFRASILAGLSAGISGISFWGWDIGGFSGRIPTAELYLRSTAMAAFCPIMQYHSEHSARQQPCRDRTPWNIGARAGDPQVVPVYRKYANLRLNLLPYLYSEAAKGTERGLPLMRALCVEHPDDEHWREFPYQYYLGDQLLVAPVVESGVDASRVYLPAGAWYDFWTGRLVPGGQGIDCPAPIDQIPVFAKAGAIIPLNLGTDLRLGSWVGNAPDHFERLCFKVFPGADSETVWLDHLSGQKHSLAVRCEGAAVCATVPALAYDVTLIFTAAPPSRVLVDNKEITRAEDLGAWKAGPSKTWCHRREDSEVLVRLASSNEPRKVRLWR